MLEITTMKKMDRYVEGGKYSTLFLMTNLDNFFEARVKLENLMRSASNFTDPSVFLQESCAHYGQKSKGSMHAVAVTLEALV